MLACFNDYERMEACQVAGLNLLLTSKGILCR